MKRSTLHFILFSVGFILSYVVLRGISFFSEPELVKNFDKRSKLSDDLKIKQYKSEDQNETFKNVKTSIPKDEKVDPELSEVMPEIKSGIRGEDPRYLNYLRPEFLSKDPAQELAYLPQIKHEILQKLASEMSKSDWLQWRELSGSGNFEKSSARHFIDKLRVLNFKLGRYAETAALLFSGLYASTNSGRIFSAEEELYALMLEADAIFKNRTPAAFSSRVHLDTEITQDPSFQLWMERLRAKFVIEEFCLKNPRQFETQFLLLSTVKEEFLTKSVAQVYKKLFNNIINNISPRYREELRVNFVTPEKMKQLMDFLPDLSPYVKEFYKVSFLDKIAARKSSKAKSIFIQYSSLFPESKERDNFQTMIAGLDERSEIEAGDTDVESPESDESSDAKTESSGLGFDFSDVSDGKGIGIVRTVEKFGLIFIIIISIIVFLKKKGFSFRKTFSRIFSSRKRSSFKQPESKTKTNTDKTSYLKPVPGGQGAKNSGNKIRPIGKTKKIVNS